MLKRPSVIHKMSSYLLFLGIFLCLSSSRTFCLNFNTTRCMPKERDALFDMLPGCRKYYSRFSLDCCIWPGISCSNLTGRIQDLDLVAFLQYAFVVNSQPFQVVVRPPLLAFEEVRYLNVDLDQVSFTTGAPSFFGSFPKLKHLSLCSYREPGMAFPPWLANLTRLEILEVCLYNTMYAEKLSMLSRLTSLKRLVLPYVSARKATDWLHVVSKLPFLEHLDLSHCDLPHVPPRFHFRTNSSRFLAYLDLSFNNLQAASSWSWIFNHSSLVSLFISHNQFNGSIPNRFGRLSSLSNIDLSYNKLEGVLPGSLSSLCNLRSLDVSHNYHLKGNVAEILSSLSCAKPTLTTLSLHRNIFSGSVPDISIFSQLKKLSFHSNRLNGSLPSSFGRHSNLAIFDLHNNQLTGSVPSFSGFKSLEVLKLQNNKLDGTVHPGLGHLSRLRHLDIASNSLKVEITVSHLENLSSLRYLDFSFNSITLNVDSGWVPPFRLDAIGLASCGVGPRFPEWLRTQRNYSRLDMSNSRILDAVPVWFWNLSSVATFISLSHNQLHGIVPDMPFKFSQYVAIDLSSNFLGGTIPSFFGNTVYLNLSKNGFSGSVSFLCQNSFPIGIDLSYNLFSGQLPDCWTEFMFMSVLDLSNNHFSGELPSSLGFSTGLQSLHLRNNMFSGNLPLSFSNLTKLIYLDLGDNQLTGEIPQWIGHKLPKLTVLTLRNNSFFGSIPQHLCKSSYVQILDLSMNDLSGLIPECLCNLKAMTQRISQPVIVYDTNGTFSTIGGPYKDYISLVLRGYMYKDDNHLELVKSIDLSSNNLAGEIPSEVSCLTGLVFLNFSRNNLGGFITSKIGSLKSLESLDLSNNHLSGDIPPALSELNFLGTLNLANNNLSGRIPTGTQLQGFSASVYAGNPGLCGDPLPKKCQVDSETADGVIVHNQNHESDNDGFFLGLYISIALGFITGFWGICGVLVCKRSWRNAFFRFWTHAYDRLYVMFTLMVLRNRRQFQD